MRTLSASARAKLNDPERIASRDLWFSRLENLYNGHTDPYNDSHVFTLGGFCPRPADEMLAYSDPEEWTLRCLELAADLDETKFGRFAPVATEYTIFGVHFIDRMLGGDVFNLNRSGWFDGQWNCRYLKTPIGSLEMPDLDHDETWSLAKRSAQAFLEAGVELPLYGMPTLSSPLNIFVNLYGQEALVSMLEDEDAARHDLAVIAELIGTLHKWYRDNIPARQLQPVCSVSRTQPAGHGQVCGCTTQLISADLYRKFIAPLDDELLGLYPGGGLIHLCGGHTQMIPVFREMKHLHAIQMNDRAAGDLEQYFNGLRSDQILYLNPCPEMPAERAVEITGGKRMVLVDWREAPEL